MFYLWNLSVLVVILLFRLQLVNKHFLSGLIVLEALSVVVLTLSLILMTLLNSTVSGFLIILTFAVCEAAIGLSLLLCYMKLNGSDLIKSNNLFS
uniref:NADH dehydrogenase subunit 4L n=1 Tax=Reinia nakadai TaxID=1885842 RepID=A0A224ACI2_9EUPU|nr:NADH dehydrogenase subunit 4L [Reinia nakadai]